MVEGVFHGGKKKVHIGSNWYSIKNDARFWQSVLVHGQRVSGKLVPSSVGGGSTKAPTLEFDLDSAHMKTAMRSSSIKR